MDRLTQRRDRLVARIPEGVALLAISNPVSVTYLTGFTGDSTWLLLSKQKTLLVSDGRYEVQLAEECPGLDVHIRPPDRTIVTAVGELIDKLAPGTVGVEGSHLTLADAQKLRDLAKSVDQLWARRGTAAIRMTANSPIAR